MTARAVVVALAAVCVLAGVSFAGSFLDLGALGLPIALAIAGMKASIVLAVFMELRHGRASAWLALATAVAFLVLLGTLVVAERATRDAPPLAAE